MVPTPFTRDDIKNVLHLWQMVMKLFKEPKEVCLDIWQYDPISEPARSIATSYSQVHEFEQDQVELGNGDGYDGVLYQYIGLLIHKQVDRVIASVNTLTERSHLLFRKMLY